MSELIVYVDGFNLYHGLHAKYGRRFLWLSTWRNSPGRYVPSTSW